MTKSTTAQGSPFLACELEEKKRIFELRRALEQPWSNETEMLFYRAVTASRFGHEAVAIEHLRKFLAAHTNPRMQRKAHEEMAWALMRIGRYDEAAGAETEALRLTPPGDHDRPENENTRALYEALRNVAPPAIEFGKEVRIEARPNPLGSWDVPVEVNGHKGEWIFDSGASLSTLAESEAAKMGLSMCETGTYVTGWTKKNNHVRFAVASDLRLGVARVSNVIFLVLPDEALYIGPLKYQIQGILGLPVLRALGRVGISAMGLLQIDTKESVPQGEPNLCFDELTPIIETRHGDHLLQMFLDTGANETFLYPSFRAALTSEEIAKFKGRQETTSGAGGFVKRRTEVIPTLRLEILGRPVDLSKVSLLPQQPSENARYRDGVLGMDALATGFMLDFRLMQLQIV